MRDKAYIEKFMEIYRIIGVLKRKLKRTDYKAIKYAEGEMSAEEYAHTLEERRTWRAEINALEAELVAHKATAKD